MVRPGALGLGRGLGHVLALLGLAVPPGTGQWYTFLAVLTQTWLPPPGAAAVFLVVVCGGAVVAGLVAAVPHECTPT
jgi:hypothetical protein